MFTKKFIPLRAILCVGIFFFTSLPALTFAYKWGKWPCAKLYSEENYKGKELLINDKESFSDLIDVHMNASKTWNSTLSIKVRNQCTYKTCNESYFFGNCEQFFKDISSLPNTLSSFQSATCTCNSNCRCSEIYMKESKCARVYVNGDCSSCESSYFELNGNKEEQPIPPAYERNISLIAVREGCSLIGYEEPDYDGESTTYAGFFEGTNLKLGSYNCSCTKHYRRNEKSQRHSKFPMIQIPKTLEEITAQIKNETVRHPALTLAVKSLYKKRSSRNAYILALGITGSGKSTTINTLFDDLNLAKVGGSKSTTKSIDEYRIPVPLDEYGISNSELRVIDTPGLGDTEALEEDARFLATLDEYLEDHEDLNNKIPNVVLIFHKFTDNRYDGMASHFVKVLRCLELMRNRILDENYSNVIFVLTHFMSASQAEQRRPTKKLADFKRVIEEFTTFPRPIILTVAENKAMDYDIPLTSEGYYKLPNLEYYPRNLFEKIQHLTRIGGDPIGEAVVTAAFRDSEDFNVTTKSKSMVETKNPNVSRYLDILLNTMVTVINTTVSQRLDKTYQSMGEDLKQKYPEALVSLQKTLHMQRIYNNEDIPVRSADIIKLLQTRKFDEAELYLLDVGIGIKPPNFPQNQIVGYSYNVFQDTPLSVSPFKLGDSKVSEMGYGIPAGVSCMRKESIDEIYEAYDSRQEYVRQRLAKLNVGGEIPLQRFVGKTRTGYNVLPEILYKNSSKITITAKLEYRIFELTLNNQYILTEDYMRSVRNLSPFNQEDHVNVETWKRFFEIYGTHVAKRVHVGGAVELSVTCVTTLNTPNRKTQLEKMNKALTEIFNFLDDVSLGNLGNLTDSEEDISHTLKFNGGDPTYHMRSLSMLNLGSAADKLKNWRRSLLYNPSILTTEIMLFPLSMLKKNVPQNITSEVERASKLYFHSSLTYVRPSTRRPPPRLSTFMERTFEEKSANIFERIWRFLKNLFSDLFG